MDLYQKLRRDCETNPPLQRDLAYLRERTEFPTVEELAKYEPQQEWFHRHSNIHGIGHETRVLIHGELIARATHPGGNTADREVIKLGAMTHDLGRHDDGYDFKHGQRSAAWFLENYETLRALGIVSDTTDRDRVAYVNEWHVPPDTDAPEMTPELQTFKDADALDRFRLGSGHVSRLDPRYLRTEASKNMMEIARQLYGMSFILEFGSEYQPYQAAIEAAKIIGILQP